jgi:hypothetical protein
MPTHPHYTFKPSPSRRIFCSLFLVAAVVAVIGAVVYPRLAAKAGTAAPSTANTPGAPDVMRLVGPIRLDQDLRTLPYVPNQGEIEERQRRIFPFPLSGGRASSRPSGFPQFQSLLEKIVRPVPTMPPPVLTFDAMYQAQAPQCECIPPDTNGDVGPNHYVQSVNDRFAVYDKNGNTLLAPTTFNSLFAPLVGTPCSNQNRADPFVFYDHMADRWVVSDLAFVSDPGTSFWECIGVSQTSDPVSGGWYLYALQTDPANPTFFGDYPKFALWNNPQPGGAYHMTVNVFSDVDFEGVRVYALDRGAMLSGGPANVISFFIPYAAMPDLPFYSLVPAGFRTGNPPPAERDEFLLAVDTAYSGGVVLNQVHGWYFHVDFQNPGNSTFGTGADHLPNAEIAVAPFVSAFTDTTSYLVPQQGTSMKLDTWGDKIMTPVVYQNRNGAESLWANHTVMLNYPDGPTAIRWYQFNVTGGSFPGMPTQQQDWANGNDGLWRWMPSIAVDQNGNAAIGYSVSSATIFPSIRYAGRLAIDPLNDLAQGESIIINGGGAQTNASQRWGDYTMTTVDASDGTSFWHTNEYYQATTDHSWFTRVGKFQFPVPSPTPRATPTPRPRPSPAPRP